MGGQSISYQNIISFTVSLFLLTLTVCSDYCNMRWTDNQNHNVHFNGKRFIQGVRDASAGPVIAVLT